MNMRCPGSDLARSHNKKAAGANKRADGNLIIETDHLD
jgi:hypothetical protein